MNTALWTLLATVLMPIVCAGISKAGNQGNRYDNRSPRTWLAQQEGYRARAWAAQQNSWEALAVYVAALVAASLGSVAPAVIGELALVFIAARIAYLACYLANLATSRSLFWLLGFGSCVCLIVLGARAVA